MMAVAVFNVDARQCCEVWLTMRRSDGDSRACAGKRQSTWEAGEEAGEREAGG